MFARCTKRLKIDVIVPKEINLIGPISTALLQHSNRCVINFNTSFTPIFRRRALVPHRIIARASRKFRTRLIYLPPGVLPCFDATQPINSTIKDAFTSVLYASCSLVCSFRIESTSTRKSAHTT